MEHTLSYELHPLCTLFPRLAEPELQSLADDIRINGLKHPIVLRDNMILDGGNRYAACLKAGVKPIFTTYTGDNVVGYVLSQNLHRRHLTAGQQAAIVASAQDWERAQGRGGDRKSDQSAILHFDSVQKRAAESGASLRTQKMADKVAKADPELAKKVAHGEVSLPRAVEKITGKRPGAKPAPVQPEMADQGAEPSAEEILFLEEQAAADMERMRILLDSDDALAAMTEKCKQLQAQVLSLEQNIRGLTNTNGELIREIKRLQRAAERAKAAA